MEVQLVISMNSTAEPVTVCEVDRPVLVTPQRVRGETRFQVHDDLVMSAALAGVLDEQEWTVSMPTVVVGGVDPLRGMDRGNY